jgi:predicted dehydrogenase
MSNRQRTINRRSFLGESARAATAGAAAGIISAASSQRVQGANERVRVGFIGVGNRGTELLELFMACPEVEVAALCDVYEPYLQRDRTAVHPKILQEVGSKVPKMGERFSNPPLRFKDFRSLLEQKDIDAVCIATPDHWHAIQTIMACDAGKDVYVEKPLTVSVAEGRRMVEAAKRTGRVVQVGLNRRGSNVYGEALGLVKSGRLGKVTVARAFYSGRMTPHGIGNAPPGDPPPGLDWDLWLGPRAYRPFQLTIAPYRFRWWQDYSSQMANWGVHYLDAIRWLINEEAPTSVSAHGGKFLLKDDRTIPDTMEVVFEFKSGCLAVFGLYEACGGNTLPEGEIELKGAMGNLYVDDRSFHLVPARPGQFQEGTGAAAEERKILEPRENPTANLVRNFLDCVKSRKEPWCGLEDGHRSTTFALLANIALQTRARLEWDATREQITNLPSANQLLDYEYRKPWKAS